MDLNSIEGKIAVALAVIVAIDNALAAIPAIKANSIFQLVTGIIMAIKNAISPK